MKSNLYFAVFREFRKVGIEIPFPQREVRVRNVDGPATHADSKRPLQASVIETRTTVGPRGVVKQLSGGPPKALGRCARGRQGVDRGNRQPGPRTRARPIPL